MTFNLNIIKMKKTLLLAATALVCISASAQSTDTGKKDGFQFTTVKELPITSVKDQASTGTCWCFSTLSFLESEMIRQGCKDPDLNLSQMFVVSNAYIDKAVKYIRVDGHLNYNQGSSFGDVLMTMKAHGIVPNSVMPGLNYGTERHSHGELIKGLKGYMSGILEASSKQLTPVWLDGVKGILAAYLGPIPETFEYKGAAYSPKSYLESLPINLDDYVGMISLTHQSYYEKHPVEVADNWRWEEAYNIPLDEFVSVIDYAIEHGYTVAWATDCSEEGFTRDGIGVVPDKDAIKKAQEAGSDMAHWVGAVAGGKAKITGPVPEMTITPELRQEGYDNKTTTDDHGMHIFGIAKEQNGKKYYMVKNSWGKSGKYEGIWYVSEAFVRYKTMDILVHKDAIPKDIKKKIGIK